MSMWIPYTKCFSRVSQRYLVSNLLSIALMVWPSDNPFDGFDAMPCGMSRGGTKQLKL